MRRFGARKLVGVLVVLATATVGLPQLVTQEAGAIPGVVPPIIGNTTLGISNAPPEIQAFEAAAVEKIRQSYNLPPGDTDAVKAWARDEIAALEWLEIVRIINEPPEVRAASAQDTAVYNWMAGLVKARRVAEAQGAIDEFQRWSGLSEWDMIQPVPPDPDLGLYCSYQPPGGATGPYKGTYSTQYDQNCSTHGCTNWVGCNLAYPTVKQFTAWGAYAAAMEDNFVTPAFLDRAAGVAKTISVAAAVALGGAAAPLEVVLVGSGILPAVQLANVFPYAVRAGTIAAVSTGAIGFIVGTVIVAAVTIALEIYRITENAKISHTLIENRTKAQQATPDLKAEIAKTAGYQNLYTTFLRQTMPDVNYGCTGTATGANAPACANAPAPPAQNLATDARFIVGANRNGVGDLQVTPTIYTYDPLNWATGRLVRMSGNGWFVSTSYDLNDPSNVAGPAHPSVPDGGQALLHSQSLTIGFQDWDNRRWSARRIQDSQGDEAFAVAPLDADAQGSCASAVLGTTKNNCITYHLNYREPDGTRAVAEAVPASAIVPAVSMQTPTVVAGNSTHQLSATATTQLGTGPYTYQWVVGSSTYTGPAPQVTFPAQPGFVQVKVTATDAQGHQGTSVTNVQVLAPVSLMVLTKSFDTVAGQPVTLVARVKNLGCPGEALTACTVPATGHVQFYVDGQAVGAPAALVNDCPHVACAQGTIDFNSDYAVSEPIDGLAPTAHPLINEVTGVQTGQLDGAGHTVTAQYLGDANFLGANGGLTTVTGTPSAFGLRVRQAVPTITLDAPVYPGAGWDQPVTLHARVAPPAGLDAVPSGTIGFAVNGTKVGGSVAVDENGDATLTTTLTPPKPNAPPYTFTARYSGSTSYEQAEANQTVGPTKPGFGVVSEITSMQSPIVVPFTRPIMGVSKATFFVQRGDTGAKVPVKLTCTDAVGAAVACAKGPVSAVSIAPPAAGWIPNMNYLTYFAFPAPSPARGYPDGTVMQADGVMRRAPATVDASGDGVTYKWGIAKNPAALGGSYRQEQYAGATASFKATGTSVGIITWNGPDGGIANVKVTAADGSVVNRTIDTYAANPGGVTTTISGLPAKGQHTVLITVTGNHSASSTGSWVRVDGIVRKGVTAKSAALTPATWPSFPGAYAYTGGTKATVKFTFYGSALDWTAFVGPNNGKVKVVIDGKAVAAAQDLYAPGFGYQTFHYGGLETKAHTVVITALGTRNPASTDTIATFRGFTAS